MPPPAFPGGFEERLPIVEEAVVADEGGRDLRKKLRRGGLSPETPLELEEGVGPLLRGSRFGGLRAPRDDLPVDQERAGQSRERGGDLRELLGDAVQRAGEELDAAPLLVGMRADAVELVLDGQKRKLLGDLLRVLDRGGEHEPDRMEEAESNLGKRSFARGTRGLADVAGVSAGARHRLAPRVESLRDRLLDGRDVGADAQS